LIPIVKLLLRAGEKREKQEVLMTGVQIAVMNQSTVLSDDPVRAAVSPLQRQVHHDFFPVWGIDADLTFLLQGSVPAADASWLTIFDDSDHANNLSYHDLTNKGLPIGKVFTRTHFKNNSSWTVTACHELLEMSGDPEINTTIFVQLDETSGTLYAYEVCDACDARDYGYQIDGTLVSDFVFPEWFQPSHGCASVRFSTEDLSYPAVVALWVHWCLGRELGIGWQQRTLHKAQSLPASRAPT
jgi:hypothetical protein